VQPPLCPSTPALVLRGFGVAFGPTSILEQLDLDVPARGAYTLVGSGGVGKSTLLRTLAGHNDAQPALRTWGGVEYEGRALEDGPRPSLVAQNARLLMATIAENVAFGLPDRQRLTPLEQRISVRTALERHGLPELAGALDTSVVDLPLGVQRRLAVVRTVLAEPALLMLDEPTVGLGDADKALLLDLLATECERRALLLVTHDRGTALALGGRVALLAGGRVVETGPTAEFFRAPTTALGRLFVETGTCYLTSATTDAEVEAEPADSIAPIDAPCAPPRPPPRAPRSLHWVLPQRLAGLPRPGLLEDVDDDLAGLVWLGIDLLVNLEETETVPAAALAAAGIEGIHRPIDDMKAPTTAAALELCALVERAIRDGRRVAFHCRAGLGRTGTMLAAYLIHTGLEALDALERVRRLQPRFVQSSAQLDFLSEFERAVAHQRRLEGPIVRSTIERKSIECLSTKP